MVFDVLGYEEGSSIENLGSKTASNTNDKKIITFKVEVKNKSGETRSISGRVQFIEG